MRGATVSSRQCGATGAISIHAPHAGRDYHHRGAGRLGQAISIHAPHAGRDEGWHQAPGGPDHFNPRAPCGARLVGTNAQDIKALFQSTRPMRGATPCRRGEGHRHPISIHAPHAGRDDSRHLQAQRHQISIHAPHAGRDQTGASRANSFIYISIHAPHAGRDWPAATKAASAPYFNPRAPCGARHHRRQHDPGHRPISIHAPHAGRDHFDHGLLELLHISIHAPHAGRDSRLSGRPWRLSHFNPRAPCGARRVPDRSRAPVRLDFNPRAPCGARPATKQQERDTLEFQSTRPMRGATACHCA